MAEPVLVGSPVEQVGSLSIPIGELEEGEIPQECWPEIPFSNKRRKNFLAGVHRRELRKAAWLQRQNDRIARLSRELASEAVVTTGLQTAVSQSQSRISELEADLRSAECNLHSTVRKLHVKTQPFPKERVEHYLATALKPDGDTDILREIAAWT